ncbi:MAG: 50S ribosomal protein L6 [Oligoflexales bacterium]|nr:50S ribosomal protein L6 [Oligoflexales bacterium]
MSRIGKNVIKLPKGVDLKLNGTKVSVKGPKGAMEHELHASMTLKVEGTDVTVTPKSDSLEIKRFYGLTRTLVNNMVVGVSQGFTKTLTLIGVGYRAQPSGKGITLSLGYSHPIEFLPPAGVEIKVDKQTTVIISGADKQAVGQTAAKIRSFRPPEPYHGKGVRYADEVIVTKVGKAAGK